MAPRACLLSILCLLIIWALFGLAFAPIVIAPVAGLLAVASLVAYWRFEKEWLASIPFIFLFVPGLGGGIAYTFQSVATSALFMYFPILLFGNQLAAWAQRDHS